MSDTLIKTSISLDKLSDSLVQVTDTMKGVEGYFGKLTNAMGKNSKETSALQDQAKKLKDAQNGIVTSVGGSVKEIEKANKAYLDAKKAVNDYNNRIAKLDTTLAKSEITLKDVKKEVNNVKSTLKSSLGVVAKFASAIGMSGISLNSVVKTGMEYRKNLLAISRAQQVAGKGSMDLGVSLDYVAKHTSLAKSEFAQLVKGIQGGFEGLKPSLQEIAVLTSNISKQIGPDIETIKASFTSLQSIQSKSPALYDRIVAAAQRVKELQTSGNTGAAEEEIDSLRTQLEVTYALGEITRDNMETAKQLVAPLIGAQQGYVDVLTAQQQAQASVKDATVELYETMEPLIQSAAEALTKVVKIMAQYKETVITVAALSIVWKTIVSPIMAIYKAITISKAAMVALNITMKANPIGLIIAGITSAIAVVSIFVAKSKRASEARAKALQTEAKIAKMHREQNSLSTDQKAIYDKITKEGAKGAKTIEQQVQAHGSAMKAARGGTDEAGKLLINYTKLKKELKFQLDILNKITGSLQSQISLSEKYGLVNSTALDEMAIRAQEVFDTSNKGVELVLKSIGGKHDFNLNMSGDALTQARELILLLRDKEKLAQASSSKGGDRGDVKAKDLRTQMGLLQDQINASTKAEGGLIEANIAQNMKYVKQQEKATGAYEARLNTQRQLMESAQFGLGASVSMMQQQVDLAKQLATTYKEADESWAKRLVKQGLAKEDDIAAIRNAKTHAEAQNYINNTMGKTGAEAKQLAAYSLQYQDSSDKIMKQQQKIYDLTKNVREGYLDAIREMATGAGEFSKIIGTQDMGVTQLMTGVKKITGLDTLNTMKLGGSQEQSLTNQGVGTNVAYKYGTTGLQKGISEEQERAKLNRIHKYGDSVDTAKEGAKGNISDTGVGSAAANERDKDALKEGSAIGTENGVINAFDKLSKRNNYNGGFMGPTNDLPGKDAPRPNHGVGISEFGAKIAKNSRGQVADPSGGSTLGGGSTPSPNGSARSNNRRVAGYYPLSSTESEKGEIDARRYTQDERSAEWEYLQKSSAKFKKSSQKEERKQARDAKAYKQARTGFVRGVRLTSKEILSGYGENKAMTNYLNRNKQKPLTKAQKKMEAIKLERMNSEKQQREKKKRDTPSVKATIQNITDYPMSNPGITDAQVRVATNAKEMSASVIGSKFSKNKTEAESRHASITSNVLKDTDMSNVSNKKYFELKRSRGIASRSKLERSAVYKRDTVESTGRQSAERAKVATPEQQAKAAKLKSTQGAAAYGAGTSNTSSLDAERLEGIEAELKTIAMILRNTLTVEVQL